MTTWRTVEVSKRVGDRETVIRREQTASGVSYRLWRYQAGEIATTKRYATMTGAKGMAEIWLMGGEI